MVQLAAVYIKKGKDKTISLNLVQFFFQISGTCIRDCAANREFTVCPALK